YPFDAAAGSKGKLHTSTDPDGVTTTYTYDGKGDLSGMEEQMPHSQTRTTTFQRDVVNDGQLATAYRVRKTVNGVLVSTEFTESESRASRTESLGLTTDWNQTLPSDGAWTSTSTSGAGQKVVKTYTEG